MSEEDHNLISKTDTKKIIAVGLVVAVAFFAGIYIGSSGKGFSGGDLSADVKNDKDVPADLAEFWKVWSTLQDKFVGSTTPTTNEKVWGAIQGLTASYRDPYTVYFPPEESKAFEEEVSGNFEGVGMEIGLKDGFLVVVSPLKGTPAFRAGVLAGDRILKIDGVDALGMSVENAVKKIRGKGGTAVVITFAREGVKAPFDVSIVRSTIDIPTVDYELRSDGIFIIKLYNFNANSFIKFREALRAFVESGTDKLILDLRNNPGGYLEAAADIASWFLPTGAVVVKEDFGGGVKEGVHRSRGYDLFNENLKMLILVNEGSASASEILAGALHDHGKARLIGETTFGKGSVQELIQVSDKTSLKVTIARWLTPKGVSISNGGITPDIISKMEPKEVGGEKDTQMAKAIEILQKETANASSKWVLNSPQIIFSPVQ